MSYLIDTSVLSELRRKAPAPGVVEWFSGRPTATLHVSALTPGEIRKGIEGISNEARRQTMIDNVKYFAGLPIQPCNPWPG